MAWFNFISNWRTVKKLNESSVLRGQQLRLTGDVAGNYSDLDIQLLQKLIADIHKVADDRESKLKEYTEMLNDGITLSAAELFAEDATQQDPDRNATVWVTSEDKDFEEEINRFLQEAVDVESQAFAHAFNVVVYGECYLHTFKSDEEYKKNGVVGDYFEVERPENVAHLYRYGKPVGYWVQNTIERRSSMVKYNTIYSEADFIHFIADRGYNREQITLSSPNPQTGEEEEIIYTIRYGSSFLEAARTYFKTRMLLDDVLLLSRLTRSQFYNLFGVEVGQADTAETTRIINDVRNAVQNTRSLDLTGNKMFTSPAPLSTGGNVFYAIRDGKGSANVQTIGGPTDVRAILDIDYFDNKYYGALKVPKQFLGQAEDMPGGLGDTTLTRLDIRYARTVKRVQKILKAGYSDLIRWYWNEKKGSIPPKFEVHMFKVTTADDDEKAVATESELERIDKIIGLFNDLGVKDKLSPEESKNLIRYIVERIMGDKEVADLVVPEDADWTTPPQEGVTPDSVDDLLYDVPLDNLPSDEEPLDS